MYTGNNLVEIRKKVIKELSQADDKTQFIKNNAETMFSLDLTMYTQNNTLNSLFYNAITSSKLDRNISLHPDQYIALQLLQQNQGLILSAPTSFGKTFVVFEYIARVLPKTVFLVVPTLALIDEYKRKIIRKYKKSFDKEKINNNVNKILFLRSLFLFANISLNFANILDHLRFSTSIFYFFFSYF